MVLREKKVFRPRHGLSLTEVLIALFVMAIGMISLLALFPIGISNMHWAMQDSRLGLASAQAIAQAESTQYVQGVAGSGRNFNLRSDPGYRALRQLTDNTGLQFIFWDGVGGNWKFDTQRGSYPPVYVDPIGTALYPSAPLAYSGTEPNLPPIEPFGLPIVGYSLGAGGNATSADAVQFFNAYPLAPLRVLGIPRIGISAGIMGLESALRVCAQEDDMAFDPTGRPVVVKPGAGTSVVQRERRYSWAYMCRWPRASSTDVVDMSVVIYNSRNLANPNLGNVPGGLRTTGEVRYPIPNTLGGPNTFIANTGAKFTLGSNQVVIYLGGAPKAAPWRPNDWILDNTLILPPSFINVTVQGSGGPIPMRYWGPLLDRLQDYPVPTSINGLPVVAINGTPLPLPAGTPWPTVPSGLASGHFYRVVAVGGIEASTDPLFPGYMQILTIDRPAKTDGYDAVYMSGVVQVIEKSLGRMPVR